MHKALAMYLQSRVNHSVLATLKGECRIIMNKDEHDNKHSGLFPSIKLFDVSHRNECNRKEKCSEGCF